MAQNRVLFFVVAMLFVFASSLNIEYEFKMCLDMHRIDVLNATLEYALCSARDSPVPMFDFKQPELMKQMFPRFCKEYKSQDCLKIFELELEPCLSNKRHKIIRNLYSLEMAANKFVCKDAGKKLTELLSDPEQINCLGKNFNENGSCPSLEEWWSTTDYMELFEEESCRSFVNMIECYSKGFRNLCTKYDIIEYVDMGIKTALLSTPCKTYFMQPRPIQVKYLN